jgi:sugar (pentulose or hexulose) kinase
MRQTFIGIDLGTTFLKGAVLDLETLQLGHTERIPFPDFIPGLPVTHKEVEPHAIVAAVCNLVNRLLPHAAKCRGLVLCTQMHGLVLTDDRGQPMSNALTWQDQRALEPHPSCSGTYYDVLSQHLSASERRELGNDLWASRPLTSLYWLHEKQLISAGRKHSGQAVIPASLADFVLANLCEIAPSTDSTNAAAYGALNLQTRDWYRELIARLGLDYLVWPRIRELGEVVGMARFGEVQLPCYAPVGDHQCAVLGTLLREGELSINVSTGSQVGLISSSLEVSNEYQTRPYFDGNYLKAVIHIPAGRALNALIRLLSELAVAQGIDLPDPWAYIEHATKAVEHGVLHVNLAFFPSSCGDVGSIENVQEESLTIGHLFRGAFENMADNYLNCARRISPDQHWHRLVFSGGLVQKLGPLREIIMQRFDTDYRFAPTSDDTLLGLLTLALVCSGKANSVAEATHMVSDGLGFT